MKDKKIIIKICDGITEKEALNLVMRVIDGGKISVSKGIKHYCWVTVFGENATIVSIRRKKLVNSADSFIVYKA